LTIQFQILHSVNASSHPHAALSFDVVESPASVQARHPRGVRIDRNK